MQAGIAVQTVAITAVTLAAYAFGRYLHPDMPEFAATMAFATLSISELARAYTARSERYPLLQLGIFTNRNMNYAFLLSLALILGIIYIPELAPFFNTVPLGWEQWQVILPLFLIPSLAAEVTKYVISRRKTSA